MAIFNALLNLRELKELYSGKPVCVCPLYKGVINGLKTFEATGNPIVLPEYKSLVKLKTTFSPKQAGTGDPSPDNVRPISGWGSVKVTVSNGGASHDYDVPLPETIYGGTVDTVTGVGSEEWGFISFDGTEKWYTFSQGVALANWVTNQAVHVSQVDIGNLCNEATYTTNNIGTIPQKGFFADHNLNNVTWIVFSGYNLNEWKSYLEQQATAGTPVTVCYKLATPEPFEVSKISIPSLGSENTFFTNGENMDIIYKKEYFWSDEA